MAYTIREEGGFVMDILAFLIGTWSLMKILGVIVRWRFRRWLSENELIQEAADALAQDMLDSVTVHQRKGDHVEIISGHQMRRLIYRSYI